MKMKGGSSGSEQSHARGGRKQPSRWTPEEDDLLRQAYAKDKCWGEIARALHSSSGGRFSRSAEQCSQRWGRVISPGIRKGAWTVEEDGQLQEAVARWGIRAWARISAGIPGRTDIQCRTRWLQSRHREHLVHRLRHDASLHPMHRMQCVDFEFRPDLVRRRRHSHPRPHPHPHPQDNQHRQGQQQAEDEGEGEGEEDLPRHRRLHPGPHDGVDTQDHDRVLSVRLHHQHHQSHQHPIPNPNLNTNPDSTADSPSLANRLSIQFILN